MTSLVRREDRILAVAAYYLGGLSESYNQMLWMSTPDMEAAYPPE